ncbi:MAG: DUF2029 domain-containing protein [Chloroflexi bacterium]|nr:DUF2029 domain-containing protein [Chloroflexota bacterium]
MEKTPAAPILVSDLTGLRDLSGRRFLAALAVVYGAVIVAGTLTIAPYWGLGWDVKTFIAAGQSFFDGGSVFDLYQKSRAAFYWPYAYPPLHALLVAPFVWLHQVAPALPEQVLVRLPVVIADLALAALLYVLLLRRAGERRLARLAALLWLFNPVTLYQTLVQGHFESEWLLLVLVAYALVEARLVGQVAKPVAGEDRLATCPTDTGYFPVNSRIHARAPLVAASLLCGLLLGLAILSKQVAVLYAVPLGLWLLGNPHPSPTPSATGEGVWRAGIAAGVATLVVIAGSLPFWLYSPDFRYMVTTYVAEMPVQTQSALVWLLLLKSYLLTPQTSTFSLIRYSTFVVAALATLVAAFALWRRKPLAEVGLYVTIVFFLFSQKVMGYYYVMLIPFLLLALLPRRRFDLLGLTLLVLSWIFASPYFAPFANPAHTPLYAALGTLNSLFFVWLAWYIWTGRADQPAWRWPFASGTTLALAVCGLTLAMLAPILAQPLHEAAFVGGQAAASVVAMATLLLALVLLALWPLAAVLGRLLGGPDRPTPLAVGLAALYFPLYFSLFYLVKESTAILEAALKLLGL